MDAGTQQLNKVRYHFVRELPEAGSVDAWELEDQDLLAAVIDLAAYAGSYVGG